MVSINKAKKKISGVTFVSQNVRGLKSGERLDELFRSVQKAKIFAACIQETWRSGNEILKYESSQIVLSGLEESVVRGKRGSQGVGIVLSLDAVEAWKAAGFEIHNDLGARIVAVRFMLKDKEKKDVGLFLVNHTKSNISFEDLSFLVQFSLNLVKNES